MLLRKRAWDIAREEYPVLHEKDSLAKAMFVLTEWLEKKDGCLCALVLDRNERLKGVVSIWDTIRFMERALLHGSAFRGADENRFEQMFDNACKVSGSTSVHDIMDTDMTVVSPDEPLVMLLETFVKKGRSYAVVKEGPRVIGAIMITDVYSEISKKITQRVHP